MNVTKGIDSVRLSFVNFMTLLLFRCLSWSAQRVQLHVITFLFLPFHVMNKIVRNE